MQFFDPLYIIAILVAIAIHECAHAYAAYLLGDDTARLQGRMTLNPLSHIDLMGALLFVTVGFGWAKPVPVNPVNLRHPKRDMAIVAVAGPLSNLLLAFLCYIALYLLYGNSPQSFHDIVFGLEATGVQAMVQHLLLGSLLVNLGLMAFNLLPVPPLDGSNILRMWIPWRMEDAYMRWMQRGPMILLCILIAESFTNIRILSGFIDVIVAFTLRLFSLLPL